MITFGMQNIYIKSRVAGAFRVFALYRHRRQIKAIFSNFCFVLFFTDRVVDELNPEANFTKQEIMTLICNKVNYALNFQNRVFSNLITAILAIGAQLR